MPTNLSLKEVIERRVRVRGTGREPSGSPVSVTLRRIAPMYEPVTVIRCLTATGLSLRKAHESVGRLAADHSVTLRLPAVENPASFAERLGGLGVEVETRAAPDTVDVRSIREQLELTQAEFAARFGFALDTVQNWEQGRNKPDAPTRTLLRVIERHPQVVEDVLTESALSSELTPA